MVRQITSKSLEEAKGSILRRQYQRICSKDEFSILMTKCRRSNLGMQDMINVRPFIILSKLHGGSYLLEIDCLIVVDN